MKSPSACKAFLTVLTALVLGGGFARAAAEADLMVGYDQTHASSVGGADNVEVLAANAIAGSNLINEHGGTGAKVRIVGYHQAAQYNYQRTSNGGFVGWLGNYDDRLRDVTDAGDAAGADLVTFVCDSTDDGAAAVANQPGRYSSFDSSQFWSTVVAHELAGHNYGCDHRDGHTNPKTVMLHNYCGGGAQGYYSNLNMWLNGTRLAGGDSCLGTGPNGGDNSAVISGSAQGVSDRNARVVAPPNLTNVVRHWSFNQSAANAPAGTAVTDSVSGTALATVQGTGATFTDGGLRIPGGAGNSGAAYLSLPGGVVSGYTNATIEIWATPLSVQNWARVMDFNNGTSNYLTLSAAIGTDLTAQRFESKVGGATVTLDSDLPTTAGVPHHFAIVYTSTGAGTGRWQWFRDGDSVAFLDVAYPLSSFPDVNNWLGRSAYAVDSLANCDYSEVRISNVAMSRNEILANYQLGPNWQSAASHLTADDPLGSTSFNAAGRWSDALAPSAGKSYETYASRLRTPADGTSRTFAGQSLKLTGGGFTWKGTSSSTITVNDLTFDGDCEAVHAGSGTWTLAGNLTVDSDQSVMRAANGPVNLTANLTGSGKLSLISNAVTLGGSNSSFAGKIAVGDGRIGILAIDSETRLGPNPSSLVTDLLSFNRGTLQTSANITLDNTNRGITFGVNGGTFNVAGGTTLTLSCPLFTADFGASVVAGAIRKSGSGTMVLNSTSSTFTGTLYVDSGSTSADDGIVKVVNNQVLANAHNPIFISNNTTGGSRLQIDGSTGGITLTRVSMTGRNGATPGIQSLAGTNNIGGLTIMAGGSNCLVQCDAGLLNFTGSIYSGVTGNRTITFQGNGDIAALNTISELTADTVSLVKSGTGTLTLAGACSHDGTTTLSGGKLFLNGSLTTTGTMSTAAGTTFAGTGSSNAATTINGIHAPGNSTNSTGTQTFTGALAYNAGAKLNWALVANSTAAASSNKVAEQAVTVTSGAAVNLALNGPGGSVDFTNAFWTQPRSWQLLTATAMTGQFALGTVSADSAGHAVATYGTFALQQSSTGVTVIFYPLNSEPPPVPTGLTAAGSPGTVALAWNASAGAATYNVKRSTTSGGPYDAIATGVTATTYNDTSVENGTTYYYVVTAANLSGESGETAEAAGLPHVPSIIDKAANTTALNLSASWTGGVLPSVFDRARWAGLPGSNSVALGSNTSLNGLIVATTGGAVTLSAGNTLTLGMNGVDLGAASQNLTIASGLTLGAGHQPWTVAAGRTLTTTGALTRAAGSTLLIDKSAGTGTVAGTSFSNASGITGPWAFVKSSGTAANNSANGHTYTTKDGSGNLVSYTAATSQTALTAWGGIASGGDGTANHDINSSTATLGATGLNRNVNTLRYTGSGARQPGNNAGDLLTINGFMNGGTGAFTIGRNGANVTNDFSFGILIGATNELVLAPMTSDIVLYSFIKDGAGGAGAVTIVGNNAVTFAGASTFTGGLNLNSGTLLLGIDNAIGTGTLTINGGEIRATGASRTLTNNVVLNGGFTLGRSTNFSGPVALNSDIAITSANPDLQAATTSTLSGVISGTRGLAFNEGANPIGTIILSGSNIQSGGTTLNAGILQLGNASALGAANGRLTVNGGTLNLNALSSTVGALSGGGGVITNQTSGTSTLTTNSAANSSFAGALQNGGGGQILALIKQGAGILTLTGTSNYTGATTVSGGTLMVNGSLTGSSAVAVGNGASLAGTGTSSGTVNVASGGALAPGTATAAGTLTISGPLTLTNGSVLAMKLAAPGASSKVALGGTFSASGVTTINLSTLSGFGPGVYPLITGAATLSASNFALGTTPPGYTCALSANAGTLSLTVAAPLPAPTGLTATGIKSGISLIWNAVPGADSYTLKRSSTSGGSHEIIATGIAATNYTDPGLTGDSSFYYVVSAANLAGPSDDSSEAGATVLTPIDAWRQLKFGTANNVDNAVDFSDPDFDELSNLFEYAIGTEPLTSSAAAAPHSAIIGGKLTIIFTRNTEATDVILGVAASDSPEGPWTEIARSADGAPFTDNINGTPTGATVGETGSGDLRNVQVGDIHPADAAHPKRFLRLIVIVDSE